jgi:hypothetical protein
MLYLIGGPPRMGKSALAQKLLEDDGISGVSTDGLTVMLKAQGVPVFYSPLKADRFYPYLKKFIGRIMETEADYVIEGDAFMPRHVAEIAAHHPVQCVFLGMSEITPRSIIEYQHYDTWANQDTPAQLENLVARIISTSRTIKAQCRKHNLPYVDLSGDYDKGFTQAYQLLT